MKSGKFDSIFIISAGIFLLMLIAPAAASPFPVVIRGTILELNATDQTLILRSDCEHSWCQVNVSGMYRGQVPGTSVFSSLKQGDRVEAVFTTWYMDLHDPATGYINPSDEVRDIRTWRSVQKLVPGNNASEFVGTDVFGDTAYLAAPLASGYTVEYDVRGPPPGKYDFRITPPGTTASITLKRGAGVAGIWSLMAGESLNYTDPSDNSSVSVTFVGGYRPDTYGLESCPCTDLTVRIISDETTGIHVIPVPSSPVPTQKAPALPALSTLGLGCVIGIRGLLRDSR